MKTIKSIGVTFLLLVETATYYANKHTIKNKKLDNKLKNLYECLIKNI